MNGTSQKTVMTSTEPEPEPSHLTSSSLSSRLPVRTLHCRFCNHLLLATTRDITRLPRRKEPALDTALILPLPRDPRKDDADGAYEADSKKSAHATFLLSTITDRKSILVRRDDGIEKRQVLRCRRCRVAMGYSLDSVHFTEGPETDEVVYLLPGSLVETESMGEGEEREERMRVMDREWNSWSV